MARSVNQQLGGWGNYPIEPCSVFRPEKIREVADILDSTASKDYIPRGLGRSYGDAALNRDGGVILGARLNRLLAFDPQSLVLECEAGVSLADIIDVFLPRGFFLPVVPGTKYVTVGGAIAADIHGKNHHRDGAFSQCVRDFTLLLPGGQVLDCSRETNSDVFWATLGGMGLTGIILSARLTLTPVESAYITVDYLKARNLDHAMASFAEGDRNYRYSVAWIDCLASGSSLGRSVLMRGNHTRADQLPASKRRNPLDIKAKRKAQVPFFLPGFVLNPATVGMFNSRFYRKHRDETKIVDYDSFFFPLDSILHWNRMYGRRGFIQYQAAFPQESSQRGIASLLETMGASRRASFLAVLKTFGPSDDGLLSFPMPGHTLALDIANYGDLPALVAKLDQIVLNNGGRVYLAKDACLAPQSLAPMYPGLQRFREIRQRLDPERKLASSLARRLGIVEER